MMKDVELEEAPAPSPGEETAKDVADEPALKLIKNEAVLDKAANCANCWSHMVELIMAPLLEGVYFLSHAAAVRPRLCVVSTIFLSIALVVVGLMTGFAINVDEDELWTPINSKPIQHGNWISSSESGFPIVPRYALTFVHNEGSGNALTIEAIRRVFISLDTIRDTPGYSAVCKDADPYKIDEVTDERTCRIYSVTEFWNSSRALFESSVTTDEELLLALSSDTYGDGTPVDREAIMGKPETIDGLKNGTLKFALSFLSSIAFPETSEAEAFESDFLDNLSDLSSSWAQEVGNPYRLDYFAERSFGDEFERAIVGDIYLIPLVFIVMSIFCCIIFSRRNRVESQSLLGFGAVVSVVLAIMSGYGLLFITGTDLTSLTQILPFIMFGIGLDDAFVIIGAFNRLDRSKDVVDRIQETMEDIGGSILITTFSSSIAFALGATSSVPAVRWLCLYAFPTIIIDFLYQITFFVALIVIDDKRMQDRRRDCLVCCKANTSEDDNEAGPVTPSKNFVERLMAVYAETLMKPPVKIGVLVLFLAWATFGAYRTSKLTQEFDFADVLPSGSYVSSIINNQDLYINRRFFSPEIYFRDVDFSDESTRQQMKDYVDELTQLDFVSEPPVFFWLNDYDDFVLENSTRMTQSFEANIADFLSDPVYESLYGSHIVIDEQGMMTASRTKIVFDGVDDDSVTDQIEALREQREVTVNQPINEGQKDWKFFTYEGAYYIWQFYTVAVDELIFTTVFGVIAVSSIAMLMIQHWSAVFFVGPMVCMLYVELLGLMELMGLHVNSVTYVGLVMSIGLMVDYVMHVVIKYFESKKMSREAKVKDTLNTIGSSVLIGGLSTFLGIIPLAFSTSEIFWSIFVIFVGLVILGCAHGLILLPVILSYVGPTGHVHKTRSKSVQLGETNDDE